MTPQQRNLLLLAAAVSSASGLASELLLGTLASYLVGNEALSYGIAVGGFLAAMGVGAYLSRFVENRGDRLLSAFLLVELLIAPLNAILPLGLFILFIINGEIWLGLSLVTLILGTLAGLEIPLLTRIVEEEEGVKDALALGASNGLFWGVSGVASVSSVIITFSGNVPGGGDFRGLSRGDGLLLRTSLPSITSVAFFRFSPCPPADDSCRDCCSFHPTP